MRKSLLYFSVIFVGILFISRLFYLQVYSNKEYNIFEDNAIRKVFTYPKRGYIFDRNNKLLVSNQPSYDVMIIPREVKTFDTIEFCNLLKIDRDFLIKKYKRTKSYSPRIPQVFLAHLSKGRLDTYLYATIYQSVDQIFAHQRMTILTSTYQLALILSLIHI